MIDVEGVEVTVPGFLGSLLGRLSGAGREQGQEPARGGATQVGPEPIHRRVLMVVHDPVLSDHGGVSLRRYAGWRDPDVLARGYVDDLREASHGYANYEIVERLTVRSFPVKMDGFRYDGQSYLRAWRTGRYHDPDLVDYLRLVEEFKMVERVNRGEIDEVWLFAFPGGGYYESIMAGPGAFFCNGGPLPPLPGCRRRFIIMGFSYERGVGEMLEDLGHRAESILRKAFETATGPDLFERFTRHERIAPGRAECGNVHFAPNSQSDYDWGNPRPVLSRCDNWYDFPDLSGQPRLVDCREWGNGDIRAHHLWWLRHLPHFAGATNGVSWNWWEYVVDPNRVGA